MLFRPAPAKLLSWNQKPSLSQHAYCASLQHVWTRLSQRVPQDYLQLQRWCPWFDSHAVQDLPRSKYQIWGLKRRTRLHDVHVCKRMSFAGSAGSICKLIQMWELLGHKPVCTRMKGIGGHVIPSSTCKIAVMKPKVVLESTLIFIRFPAARVKSPLRERVPQDYLQLQRWCPWFDSHAANNF